MGSASCSNSPCGCDTSGTQAAWVKGDAPTGPKAEGIGLPSFDGSWASADSAKPRATIAGQQLTWPSGRQVALIVGPTTITMTEDGTTYTGELSGGKLRWSDNE